MVKLVAKNMQAFTFVVISLMYGCKGARILEMFVLPSISHANAYRAFTEVLAREGHDVVVITPVQHNVSLPTVTEIDVADVSKNIYAKACDDITKIDRKRIGFKNEFLTFSVKCYDDLFNAQINSPQVKHLIKGKSNDHFDVIFLECCYWSLFGIAKRFQAPIILTKSMSSRSMDDLIEAPSHPLMYSEVTAEKTEMNLLEDIKQLLTYIQMKIHSRSLLKISDKTIRSIFGSDTCTAEELGYERTALMLFPVHFLWEGIRPIPPRMVLVGGIGNQAPKKLPEHLKVLLDASKRGVVYMSLGSRIRSSSLPTSKVREIVEGFRRLPFDVVWKWEEDELLDRPSNVFVAKWLPQADLLQHPKVMAFVTQGGLQSTNEAIFAKVPLIGIPFNSDQPQNVEKYKLHGIGIGLDLATISADIFKDAIIEVIFNPSYKAKITRLATLVADQPQTPHESMLWWAQYVVRHGGTAHLRGHPDNNSAASCYLLDVLAAVLLALMAAAILTKIVTKLTLKMIKAGIAKSRQSWNKITKRFQKDINSIDHQKNTIEQQILEHLPK